MWWERGVDSESGERLYVAGHPRVLHPESEVLWDEARDRPILNHYMEPIVNAGYFVGIHFPAIVPAGAGCPPVCSCGWTRRSVGGVFIELPEHIADMGEFGTMSTPWGARG